ncbi:MAG: valine--tRNA ligase [Deltaproteobacteria bacterium]|nr:valine--tRNA ligase [Deltaproteobacteria bacterium]
MNDKDKIIIEKTYNPRLVEERWYSFWTEKGYFTASTRSKKKPFTIVIPPPNVTGSLHIGHALNNTLQDILVRYKRMKGYEALWVPGTDHAGIATQTVVERELMKHGIKRSDMDRDEFINKVWRWKEQYGKRIVQQLKRLGASCDWSRERFTMDEGFSLAVKEVFVRLYDEGLIYRGYYLVNWCPRCETALSDLEVIREDTNGKLYYIKYPLVSPNSDDRHRTSRDDLPSRLYVVVATTRPETMMGDTAVAVNPKDKRYEWMIGKEIRLPVVNRVIPVIADEGVDIEMGTGALKITPAHDFADFEIGNKHNLPRIQVIDVKGIMTENAGKYRGLDRFECRRKIIEDFEREGLLDKVEDYLIQLGKCYRCGTVVEPMLSLQWFVKTRSLAEPALAAVEEGRTRIIPEGWFNTYSEWMRNIRDWCISRQIWWGHRIPAWFCKHCEGITVSVDEPTKCDKCESKDLQQETDVLDTWFSSGLWPFAVMGWPRKTEELRIFYPTSVLVTSFDILFFWVARMMMMGIKFMGEVPFRDVYIHALVRDEMGEKMSKTRGNVIDPLEIMDDLGADALRFSLSALASQGRDIRLSLPVIEGYRNFMNKIWNASRFVLMNLDHKETNRWPVSKVEMNLSIPDKWIITKLNMTVKDLEDSFDHYEFDRAARLIYQFVWGDFCDWYIEIVKPVLYGNNQEAKERVRLILVNVLSSALQILSPIAPFITEEIYHKLREFGFNLQTPEGNDAESIAISSFPSFNQDYIQEEAYREIEFVKEVIIAIRNLRAVVGLHPTDKVEVILLPDNQSILERVSRNTETIISLAGASSLEFSKNGRPEKCVAQVIDGMEVFLPVEGLIDIEKEIGRIKREIEKVMRDIDTSKKKLSNSNFLDRAPEEVVEKEREKFEELSAKRQKMEEVLKKLSEIG